MLKLLESHCTDLVRLKKIEDREDSEDKMRD